MLKLIPVLHLKSDEKLDIGTKFSISATEVMEIRKDVDRGQINAIYEEVYVDQGN